MATPNRDAVSQPEDSSVVPPAEALHDSSSQPRALRSLPGSALRKSNRYSPYRRETSGSSSSSNVLESPAVTCRVMFSPPHRSSNSACSLPPPVPVQSPRTSTPTRSPSSTTPTHSPRTPRTPRSSTPTRSPNTPGTPRTRGSSRRSRSSPLKTGRPRDMIWKHYTIERENGKKREMQLQRYAKKFGKPSENLLNHLVKPNQCPSAPRYIQISLRPAPTPAPMMDPTVQPATCALDQDDFDLALARVFFVCALPFKLLESQVFRDFIALLAPSIKLPSRHKLSTVLLKRVRDEIQLKVIQMLNAHNFVSLVADGWTDTNGSSIINFMVVSPGLPSLFWASWSTRSNKHTARYLAGEIDKVIQEIESETTALVVGIVTDNAKSMRSASSQVQSRHSVVISGGRSAHVLNLLMQDIGRFPAIKGVISRAVAATRFVRDHLALYDEFKQLRQGVRDAGSSARNLVLPVPTRWYSVHACLRNLLNCREVLEKLFLTPGYDQFMDRYRGTA